MISIVKCAPHTANHPFATKTLPNVRGAESMVMKFHGNARVEVRVNFLALCASKPHISCAVTSNCPGLFARPFA